MKNCTYLNVCVLGDELDEALEAVEEVAGAAEDALDRRVLLVGLLDLLLVVLEDDSNELDEGNQESAHSQGAQVVSVGPVHALHDGGRAGVVGGAGEVPLAAGGGDNEHRRAHDEGIEPEVAEERVKNRVARILFPLDLGEHREVFTWSYFTHRSYVHGRNHPHNKPAEDDQAGQRRHNEDLRRPPNELRRRLHDRDRNPNVLEIAEQEDQQQCQEAPHTVRSVDIIVFVLVGVFHL